MVWKILCGLFVFTLFNSACFGFDLNLEVRLPDEPISEFGCLVGEMVLKNEGRGIVSGVNPFSVVACYVDFQIRLPGGENVLIEGYPNAHFVHKDGVKLGPGEFLIKPISLMKDVNGFFFKYPGEYAIKAEYKAQKGMVISSEWVNIQVETADADRDDLDKYLDIIGSCYFDVIDPFQSSRCVDPFIEKLGELSRYKSELAKIIIFQGGGGKVLRSILRLRERNEDSVRISKRYLEIAREFGYGVEMWEYLLEMAEDPDKIKLGAEGVFYPKNSYYF